MQAGELFLARPLGVAALALPILLVITSRLRLRPEQLVTGTLALWREIDALPRSGARSRRATPLSTWMAVVALALGALALAGPRRHAARAAGDWTVVIDRSPSMFLAHEDGGTRLEVALDALEVRLGRLASAVDRVRWVADDRVALELPVGERPPAEWLAAPRAPLDEPRWELHDELATFWVTDRVPARPGRAGFVASGGELAAGAIACERDTLVVWDGERVTRTPTAPRAVALEGDRGSARELVGELAALWARERGLLFTGAPEDAALVLRFGGEAPSAPVRARAERWALAGEALVVGEVEGEVFLADAQDRPLVVQRPGLVRIAFRELEPPEGDPAAFALDWSRLFERALLPAPGVVPLGEREAAGASGASDPRAAAGTLDGERARISTWDAWLALGAAAFALLAAALRR